MKSRCCPTPDHPTWLRFAYLFVGIVVTLTGGLGNALVSVNLVNLQGALGAYATETAWLPQSQCARLQRCLPGDLRDRPGVGYSSRLDWAQAQAEYHVTAAVVPQTERAIAQQENALDVLVGASPGPIARGAARRSMRWRRRPSRLACRPSCCAGVPTSPRPNAPSPPPTPVWPPRATSCCRRSA